MTFPRLSRQSIVENTNVTLRMVATTLVIEPRAVKA